jgi:hypothetical protein
MAVPSEPGVRRIVDARAPWCVTVYGEADAWLRGNHPGDVARAQIRAAVHALLDAGAPADVADEIHRRLEQLTTAAAGQAPLDHRLQTVGIFATPDRTDMIALTTAPAPWVGVGDRFLIAPLVEGMLALHPPALVLAASENRVRVIDASTHPAAVVDVPDLPHDLRSSIRLDITGDRETLTHLRTSEDPKERLREYARDIHRAVEPVRRAAGAVLVLAAAEPLLSALQATAPSPSEVVGDLRGNHDDDSPERLAELAETATRQRRDQVRAAQLDRLSSAPPALTATDLDLIERAAAEGAIDTLFIDTDWRDPAADAGAAAPMLDRGDELVRRALATDATIVPLHPDVAPGVGPVAGLLRHAMTPATTAGR